MTKEREFRYKDVLIPLSTVGFFLLISFGAFSRGVKREIHERDGWVCVGCGKTYPLEASHYNHNRSYPDYNTADNGDTRCPACHLEQHKKFAGRNGLSIKANNWAIERLSQRA